MFTMEDNKISYDHGEKPKFITLEDEGQNACEQFQRVQLKI